MTRLDLNNLETQQTLKQRIREAFWALLRLLVVCYVSWELSVYLIKFWQTQNLWHLISPAILAVVLLYPLALADKRRWWLAVPAVLAFLAPIVLESLGQRVQPNSRFLSDAYESALGRASYSAPKPER